MIEKLSVQTQSRVIRPLNVISQTMVCAHLSHLSTACSFSVTSLNCLSCDKKLGFIPGFYTENKELDSDFLTFSSCFVDYRKGTRGLYLIYFIVDYRRVQGQLKFIKTFCRSFPVCWTSRGLFLFG